MTRGRRGERVHGTRAGYLQHLYRGEQPCAPCAEASRVEVRARRDADPAYRAKARAYSQARGKALTELRRLHPIDFEVLFARERARQDEQDNEAAS